MLSLVTLLTFANSWPNSVVFDDKAFVGPDRLIKLESFGEAFTQDIWANSDTANGLYRPLLQVYFEVENRLFGDWLEGFHLVNIFLHLAATLLLFGFLRYLVTRTDARSEHMDLIALLPALVFAVHPAHTEVVNSIFNGSSIIVAIFTISSLWWLLSRLDTRPVQAWLGMGLAYTLAIFIKESALVLPGIAVAMILLLTEGSFMTRVRRVLPVFLLLIPLIIYFWARGHALAPEQDEFAVSQQVGNTFATGFAPMFKAIMQTIGQNLVTKLATFGLGMKVLAWPYPLQLYYGWIEAMPALFYILLQAVLVTWALVLLRRGKAGMAAGLAFFYIALTPSIRIISLDGAYPHLTERYLYVPSIGMAIVLGVAYRYLFDRFGRKKVALLSLPVLVLLAALCWERNNQWSSNLNLFETEYAQGYRGQDTLRILLSAHNMQGNTRRVVQICEENPQAFKFSVKLANTCAVAFMSVQRTDDAIAAIKIAAEQPNQWIKARISLAAIYIAQREHQKAADLYAEIVNGVEEPEKKEMYKGDLYVTVFKKSRTNLLLAQKHYLIAAELRPGWRPVEKRLAAVEVLLAEMDESTGQEPRPVDPQKGPE